MLGYLEAKHNIVYFDVRGGGRSVIDGDNKYDQFLRAEYVADDIERIRKALLGKKPWDAIYSHSWGSVPAQIYAARFGAAKVKSLVLSAPVVRDRDTHAARGKTTAENLARIFSIYRSQAPQPCTCQDKKLPVKVITFFGETKENINDVKAVVGPPGSNNFCFFVSR
jgi:pimeloyl-ACP methyl ester carboxylesterase